MKEYNGEKAIISLTSWKARINIVSKTIFNLITTCPDFHIVLVLSSDEFPNKEDEFPEDLKLICDNNLIEILWVEKNYKAFKKVLFTMKKYPKTPIISADDDCIYSENYAGRLFSNWLYHQRDVISLWSSRIYRDYQHHYGPGTLYPPGIFNRFDIEKILTEPILATCEDDILYTVLLHKMNIKTISIGMKKQQFHDEIEPLHDIWKGKTNTNFKIIIDALKDL